MHDYRALVINGFMACLAAFQYLTRFPLPVRVKFTENLFQTSIVFYPFVGALIGLIITLAGAGLRDWLPGFPAAILVLCLWIVITGAMNLTGLLLIADGILHHRTREQMQGINKADLASAMGIIVCVLYLLLKLAFIMELLDGTWRHAVVFLFCTPLWSRWFIGCAIAARHKGLFQSFNRRHITVTAIAFLLSFGALWIFGYAGIELFYYSLGFPIVVGVLGYFIALYLISKLGELTRATYGVINELLEIVLLFGALMISN